ncbi:RNA-binding S4 domain-containing protein [Paucibacter sp. DJ1R-11]|uniref:RNA-binding S4 domain-containing protein n=1 Tax=Paucibacter sp. DJ1R-11 TaxID=2893556 RepID=UPI0021E50DAD|nr:RNA-binding S4 domain-containing protein [Paucibacter sp. DJ1R-11]MCV2363730.1 RNA-binding S4 domain-containing protein [Paucibacter sp. DJ1R-11]
MKSQESASAGVRLDKWLWAARFFKTRSLAAEEIGKGRVQINGQLAKASRELKLGDLLRFRQGVVDREVRVLGLSPQRGPASQAQGMYEETPDSVSRREQAAERRRLAPEPAATISQGRPTKQDRRRLSDWERWSAAVEPE